MYNRRTHFGFDWGELLTGVALLIGAIVMWRHPSATLMTLSFIFALVTIMRGITILAAFPKLRQFTGNLALISALAGVFDLILGGMFLFDLVAGAMTLAYLFAFWFIADSVAGLTNAGHLKQAGTGWWLIGIFFNLIGMVAGFLLLMQPVVSAVGLVALLALAFLVLGINEIFTAFARQQV